MTEERKRILDRIKKYQMGAARWVREFKELPEKTIDNVYPLIEHYVRDKFLLRQNDCVDGDLLVLADISIRRTLKLRKEGVDIGDISAGCSGASSVIAKKVLLMKAAQEDFDISLTAEESAAIRTIEELAQFIVMRYKR